MSVSVCVGVGEQAIYFSLRLGFWSSFFFSSFTIVDVAVTIQSQIVPSSCTTRE